MLRKLPVLLAVGTFSAMLAAGAFATGPHDATTDPAAHDRLHTAPASGGPLQNTGARATGFDATTDPAAHDWLHTAPASSGPLQNTVKGQHLGSPASEQYVDRQIELRPGTRYVNVTWGETVVFKVNGKTFAWKFDTLGTPVFALPEIAPKNISVPGTRVYVGQSPLEHGG